MKYKKAWRTAAAQFEASTMLYHRPVKLKFLQVKYVTGIKWENNWPLKKTIEFNFITALSQILE